MRLLSLDMSISSTGYAVIIDGDIVEVDRIVTEGKELSEKSKKHLDYTYFFAKDCEDARLYYITKTLHDLIKKYDITDVVLENVFLGKSPKVGLLLSKLKGFVVHMSMHNKCNVHYLLPTEVRKFLFGKGKADKELVALHIRRSYIDVGDFSDKAGKNKTSDKYDALGCGIALYKKFDLNINTYEN